MSRETIEDAVVARTRALREAADLTQGQIAELLGCGEEQYRKYETRSAMKVGYIAKFCVIVNCDIHYFITGHRKAPNSKVAPTPAGVAKFPLKNPSGRGKRTAGSRS